jgi:filamentous hemagglutinin
LTGDGILSGGSETHIRLDGDYTHSARNVIASRGDLTLETRGTLTNAGKLQSPGMLKVSGVAVHNQPSGSIQGQKLKVALSHEFTNSGSLIAAEGLNIEAKTIDNARGSIQAGTDLEVKSEGAVTNQGGRMNAGGPKAGDSKLRVIATSIDNTSGVVANAGTGDSTITGSSRITNSNEGKDPALGRITGEGKVIVSTADLRNTQGGRLAAGADLTVSGVGHVNNSGGTIQAQGLLSLNEPAATVTNTRGGKLTAAGNVTLNVASIDNSDGAIGTATGGSGAVHISAPLTVTNANGRIVSAQDLTVIAGSVEGKGEVMGGNDTILTLTGDGKRPSESRITAKRNLTLTAVNEWKNAGSLGAGGIVTAKASVLHNQGSAVIEGKTSQITATENLINEGRITGETVALEAVSGRIDNKGGRVDGNSALTVTADQLHNTGGVLALRGTRAPEGAVPEDKQGLKIKVQKMDNSSGYVRNLGDQAFTVTADTELINDRGTLYGLGPVDVTAGRIVNTLGQLQGSSVLTVKSKGELKNEGGLLDGRDRLVAEAKGAISNQGGRIVVGEDASGPSRLEVSAESIDNRGGRIANAGTGDSIVTGSSLISNNNESKDPDLGLITGHGKLTVHTADLRNTQGGYLTAGADLTLSGVRDLDNSGGTVRAQGALSLKEEAAIVTNTGGGKLTAAGNVTLQVASIDNRHGEIGTAEGGSGTVQITAPIKVANAGGRLVSAHDLTVRAGSVEGKGEITGGNDTTLTLIGDGTESSENRITAGHNLTLTATKTWKNAGSLRAPGTVAVVADEFLNQHSGLLSAGTVQITGTQKLTNEGKGQILGKSVTLQSDREIVNDGTVISQGNATLTSKGVIHNAETGTLSAQRDLEINAAEIVSKGDLGAGLSGDGAAVNPGNLKLTATHQLKVTGQSLAGGDLTFTGPSLMLPGATAQAGNITLVANGGDIMHQGGQLHARGAFRATATSLFNQHGTITEAGHGDNELKISGTINNESGIIASNARNLTVESSSLSNGLGGKLHHGGTGLLNLKQTGELSNAKGVLSSNGDATITAGTLNNEAGLLTAKKAITVEHTEDLQNRSGVIEAGSSLELAGRTVTNDGGRMVALGGQARIKDVIQLNNTAGTTFQGSIGGLVSGSTDTIIDAGRVNNIGGTIVADGDLTFRETKELHNSGTLSAGGGLKAHAGVLNNTRGNMTARSLDLRGSQLDNSAGELTATTLSGTVTDLINSNGKLTHQGTEPMGLAVTGTLVNTHGGQIRSNGDLLLRPEVLDNTSGTIVSSGTMAVVASVIQNHKGTLHADTSLDVRSGGTLVNEGGTLATKGNLVVQSVGILDNEAGRLQAGAGGVGNTLQVTGYVVHNAGGRIANDGTGDSTITGQHLILNSNASGVPDLGVIGGQGGVTITTAELKNNQGGQLFAGGVLALDTPKLDNTGGRAHAQVNLAMTRPGSTVENARGEMSAGGDVRLTLASLVNTEGKVVAGQDLDLTNPTLPVDGLLTAGRDASYTLQGDFQQPEGKILSAKRNLTLATTGGLTNAGSLEAGGRLILSADNIFNRASGLMYGEAALVAAKGSLKNLGKIYGTDIALDAKTIINGHLDKPPVDRFKVPTARTGLFGLFPKAALAQLNQPLQPESKAQSGVVAAHRSLQIGADTVSNEGPDTLLSSGGDLAIGGHLDEKHLAVGESVRIDNHSGTIQAVEGDMRLESKAINNLNDNFATAQVVKSSEKVNLYEAMDNPVGPLGKKYLESELKPANWGPHGATGCWYSAVGDFDGKVRLWNGYIDTDKDGRGHFSDYIKYEVTRTITCTEVARTTPGSILAGGNMNLAAGQILNDKSRIIAGKDLTFPKGHLSNTEVKGTRVTEDKGIHYFSRPGARAPWSVFGGYRAAPFSETIPKTMEVVASVHEARTRPSAKPVPAVESKGGAGPVVVPVVRLGGTTTGTPFLESGASSPSGSLATQPAATGQPQALGDVVPAIPHLRLPKGGLYSIDTSATAPSLVVTDPKFLRDKEVKGLDYMLERLELDTQTTRKRVGDGSYESQLVAQQIVDLTGRPRLIPDCATAQGEFVTLMDNGLFHADSLQLKPGASLSVPQQDALAQPSVWPVQQMVTLSEGKEAAVLVPKVYLTKERTEALAPLGSALISAETMAGNLIGNLENSGTLLAERSIAITASGIENTGRMRTTGTDSSLILHAQKDLVHAGSIQGSRVELKADQDILMRASTREITGTTSSGTILDQIATVAADTLIASAGRDLKLAASQINTTGSASLTAERNVSLETVSTGYRKNLEYGRNHLRTSETGVVGVHLDVGGSAELKAGGDLAATAASVIAEQDLKASAGGNVTLATADQTLSVDLGRYHSGGSTFSSWSEQTRSLREARTSAGNLFSGDTVRVQVGDSMTVEGSTVVGARGVALDVAGDLEIKAATNTEHTSSFVHRKESGLLSGGGLGVSFGTREQKDEFDQHSSTQSQSRSRVGAIDGDLSITVGDRAQVLGSDLLAGKDIKIVAKDVAITPGLDQADRQERHEFKQTGVTLSLGGGAISMAQGIVSHVQAARESKGDPRAIALNALAAESLRHNLAERMDKVKEAMASSKAPKDMAAAAGIRVSVSIGTSQSVSESTERTLTHTGSTVHAGGNLSISATERDLKIRGAILDSRDMTLEAVRDLELTSAVDETSSRGSNSSSSSSVGVSFGIGQGRAGVSLDLALSRGHGDSHGDSAAHQYTLATAKGNLTLKSGGDTHVIGAQASGQAIESKVGGNLKMVSPQDTFKYASTQESVGVSASIPIGPGSGSASLNMSQSNTNSDSSSVREQSRIMAGEGGFQITVEGKTQLDGAVIDSIAGPKLNTLTTGALIVTDRKNHATGSSTTSGVGIGTDMFDSRSRSNMGRGLARTALDRGEASESDASTSRSAIAPGSINVTDDKAQMELTGKSSAQIVAEVRRDTEGTHRALARPDIARLEADANAERNLNTLAFDTGVIYAERIELARQRAGNTSGGGTITNPGTANQEQTGAADSTPALDPTGDEANLGIEVPVIATITAPSDELQAERSGSRAVVVIPAVVVEETNAHGVPTGVTSMQSDFGRSEPEAPGNESKAPINQRETGRSEPGANPDSIRTRGERYGSLTLDMQRIDQADSEPRPEYHSPVDRGYPTIYPEDPTLVASFNPFAVVTGAGDTGSDWARNNVTDPAERLKNKMRGLGWIEDRYIPDALSRIAAEDPARANEISRRIEADNEIARYAGLMGGGPRVLGPGRVPLSSGGLNLPNGGGVGALAPAVATGVVEVAVDAAAVAVPTAMAMAGNQQIGPGGNAPSDGPSTPSEPTTSSARETPPRHGEYKPAPRGDLSGPIQAERVPSQGGRATWKDAKGNTYQWDSLHGRLEKYNKHGKHLGEYDSATGAQTKPAKKDRSL